MNFKLKQDLLNVVLIIHLVVLLILSIFLAVKYIKMNEEIIVLRKDNTTNNAVIEKIPSILNKVKNTEDISYNNFENIESNRVKIETLEKIIFVNKVTKLDKKFKDQSIKKK